MTTHLLSDLDALNGALGRLDNCLTRLQASFRVLHEDVGAMQDMTVQITHDVAEIGGHVGLVGEIGEAISKLNERTRSDQDTWEAR